MKQRPCFQKRKETELASRRQRTVMGMSWLPWKPQVPLTNITHKTKDGVGTWRTGQELCFRGHRRTLGFHTPSTHTLPIWKTNPPSGAWISVCHIFLEVSYLCHWDVHKLLSSQRDFLFGQGPLFFLQWGPERTYANYPLALLLVQSVKWRFRYPAGLVPGDFPC